MSLSPKEKEKRNTEIKRLAEEARAVRKAIRVEFRRQSKIKAVERIEKGRDNERAKNFDYYTERPGIGADEVHCKLCNGLLKKLVPLSDLGTEEVINGKTVVTIPVAQRETNNYAEITIEFDDGSAHATTTCKNCASHLDLEALEVIYTADLNQFKKFEDDDRGPVRWELLAHRKITGYVRDR